MAALLRIAFCCLFSFTTFAVAYISCRDQEGKPVDWFYIYKLPELKDHPNHLVQQGDAFLYLDVNNKKWVLSDRSIQENRSHAAYYTISQVYSHKSKKDAYFMMYNDEHPDKNGAYRGHSKGVQLFDRTHGFWLIHSVPRFPGIDAYNYPNSGRHYGQSFLCITFNTTESLAKIAEQLYFTEPDIYSSFIPDSMATVYSKLVAVLNNESVNSEPWNKMVEVRSLAGQSFRHFGKYWKWLKGLYANFVATTFDQSLYVETWQNGRGDLPAICNQTNHVYTMHTMNFDNVPFTTNEDHSKWCVTIRNEHKDPWICVGDINRQLSQFHRSGGTMCLQDRDIWNAYEKDALTYYDCSGDINRVPHSVSNSIHD